MHEQPILRQLLLCEKAIIDRETTCVSLINCHSVLNGYTSPTPPIDFVVYGLLTNGYGQFTMELRVNRPDSDEAICKRVIPAVLTNRLRAIDVLCRPEQIVFPVEGRYSIYLIIDGEILGMTGLQLRGTDQ